MPKSIKLVFSKFPGFRSFDPMHAEALSDSLILHTTVLKLDSGDNRLCIINHKAATTIADQIWFVRDAPFLSQKMPWNLKTTG